MGAVIAFFDGLFEFFSKKVSVAAVAFTFLGYKRRRQCCAFVSISR